MGCLGTAAAFQAFQSPAEIGNGVFEFGGFATTVVVGDECDNQGWRAHHHPTKQEQQYVIHQLARQVWVNLRCILERFNGKVLRLVAKCIYLHGYSARIQTGKSDVKASIITGRNG
jgi:hypothetical protein